MSTALLSPFPPPSPTDARRPVSSRMTSRRDDRLPPDPVRQWDRHPPDHRRHRSATLPSHPYDPRAPSHDPRYTEPRQPSRSHRQDPHYHSTPYSSYHPSSAQAPPPSKPYQHATRSSAQHPSSGYPHPQPSPAYPVASSSRRPHADAPDPRSSRRPPAQTPHPPYDQPSSGEEIQRAVRHPRVTHSSTHPPLSAPSNQAFWNPPRDVPTPRRPKDAYKDRERDPERDRDRDRDRERERERDRAREREKPTVDLENKYKDRTRTHRLRERERERVPEIRHQEQTRSRHHDSRKDSDTEGVLYSEQRNASKASLSGREGHPSSIREPSSGHRRHRTEDGTASTGRRQQPENTQNPIVTLPPQSTTVPQPDVQQTGEPPPAPRVMPVYLPSKGKSQRSYREGRPPTAQGAQSGSDTERTTGRHRMERTPSGPAVQRSDGHASSSMRDRANHDATMAPRDDVRRVEGKYGTHQDARQPLAPINVDIPLVTPGFNASSLPNDTRASTVPQIVSIRAGQGPSDPHDAYYKSSAVSHSDAPQEFVIQPTHPTSASIIKSPSHPRSQSFETRVQSDRPIAMEYSRAEPHGDDLLPGQRMSIGESGRGMPIPISKSHSYARGNPESGMDHPASSHPHSRPQSRSAHRSSANNPATPLVTGPRPLRSVSQGPQINEPSTRPSSVVQYAPTVPPVLNQHAVPAKAGHTHSVHSSAQPSPKDEFHGAPLSHSPSTQQATPAPSVHPTPAVVPQTLTTSSRPSTRDGAYTDAPYAQQSLNRQATTDDHQELHQTSNGTTVKASWVVQTPATAKRAKISREGKYLRDHHFSSETPRAQLRQVLSQDDDLFPRASSVMMKASQAITPSASSQRSSPGTKTRDVSFGTPRGTLASGSSGSAAVKETPTLEHTTRADLPSHLTGLPQIAVVGATPVAVARDLPQGRVDHGYLAPPFPAPPLVSRTTSGSQDQQPVARDIPLSSYQATVHAPSLFQPYRPPSLPSEDDGQSSPPPLPIPPPRGLEDSPPPAIETRTSEIIPTHLQTDGCPDSYVHAVPEVQSEMIHIPSQPSPTPHPSSAAPSHTGKLDGNMTPTTSNGFTALAHTEARSSKAVFAHHDNAQIVHHHTVDPLPALPSQSLAPATTPRPRVTIEDVPEDSLMSSKPTSTSLPPITPSVPSSRSQPLHHVNTDPPPAVAQAGHKSSPQSKSKDPPSLHRSTDPSIMPTAPPMSPPVPGVVQTSARIPSSAPPTHSTFSAPTQTVPNQRATSHTVPSRTQRAAEMPQVNKLTISAGTNAAVAGSVNKPATHNPIGTAISQHQPINGGSSHAASGSRLANVSATAPDPSTSVTASTTKVSAHTTSGSGPPVGALGQHIPVPSTSTNTQLSSVVDPSKQQSSRRGALLVPSLDATLTSAAIVKNPYQEQPIVDSTRPRDVAPSTTRNLTPLSHVYPTSTRPSTSAAMTQQAHVTPAAPQAHHRVVSLPVTSSSTVQRPLSPRKYSQPLPSGTVSTQPFPSRPSASESHPTRVPASGQPAPVQSTRLTSFDRVYDSDLLKTPSSIAPSPMLNPDTTKTIPQSITTPTRARLPSIESKDDKKKPPGLFGLFRTRTLSAKATDPPAGSTATRASAEQGRVHPDAPAITPTPTTIPRTMAPKEWNSATPAATSASARVVPQSRPKGRVPDPITIPPPPAQATRERKDPPHIFTPFKFLTMHSKRNRTVSAASLDVCDGNTATNTVIGSPDHSAVSQAQPLPRIIPPDIRDPLVAASEWRDREEAERRERRIHRIRRPGVTFDVEEEPPSPAPGAPSKRKKLVRRPSGRAATPGPSRG